MGKPYLNISQWIDENKKDFLPPVCNKLMHGDGQLKIFYVGGPNVRKDFHNEEGEELFYMVQGDMELVTLERNNFKTISIKEGEVFMLPGRIPHSPQRREGTIGLVIERERLKSEKDCLRYYVDDTKDTLFERWFYCENLGTQLAPVIKEFFASEQFKTGKPIPGDITDNPPWIPDANRKLEDPFHLTTWITKNKAEIHEKGRKRLFDTSYQSDIIILGTNPTPEKESHGSEVWLWQIEGQSEVETQGQKIILRPNDSYLVSSGTPYKHLRYPGSIAMFVKMDPSRNTKLGKIC